MYEGSHGGTKAVVPESHLLRAQTPAAIDARDSTGSVRFREVEGIIRDLQSGSAWSETDFERLWRVFSGRIALRHGEKYTANGEVRFRPVSPCLENSEPFPGGMSTATLPGR